MAYPKEFEAIKDGELSGLQIQNFIERETNYEPEKLRLLHQDFTAKYETQVRRMEKQVGHTELRTAFKQALKNNHPVYKRPKKLPFRLNQTEYNRFLLQKLPLEICAFDRYLQLVDQIIGDYDNQPLDKESLLFPDEFILIRHFMYHIKQLIKEAAEGQKINPLPVPYSVAKDFLNNSKHSKYSINVITLAMKYAHNYRHESNYSIIVRKFLKDNDCPPELSSSNYNTIQNWIKSYDKAAGIVRKHKD